MAQAEQVSDASLRELYELRNMVDELIEEGLVHHWSVSEMLGALLPRVGERLGATSAFVETYGEDLTLRLFAWSGDSGKPVSIPNKADVFARTSEERRERVRHRRTFRGRRRAAPRCCRRVVRSRRPRRPGRERRPGVSWKNGLNAVCEVLDNYLFSIRAMREKHLVTMQLGNALRHRVLGEGVG